MLRNFKAILAVLAIIIIAGSAYAFAAANVVPATNAGYVASVVSGYTVDTIVYDLDATDPTIVDAITFDINPTTGTNKAVVLQIQTANAGTWKTDCALVDGTLPEVHVTCTYGSLALADVTALNVVASGTTDPAP
jgi:hypothetical protein